MACIGELYGVNWDVPFAPDEGLAALCDPSTDFVPRGASALPPYVVLDQFDEPVWLFDSLEDAIRFVVESAELGFAGDVLTYTGTLTAAQRYAAREVLRG